MEIWAPEAVVVLFLILSLCRPFVKALWPLDGLNWLPFIGLGIIVGIFFAYGFRPECIPLLVFTVIVIMVNVLFRRRNSFRHRNPLGIVCVLILLSVVAVPMFVFSPRINVKPKAESEDTRMVTIQGPRGKNYMLRVYGDIEANHPLIFIVPPEIGTAASIDIVCTELKEKGFTVVTYFHQKGDRRAGSASSAAHWRITKKAYGLALANEKGKALEAERRADIALLVPQLPGLLNRTSGNMPPLILAGYGAGGSALAYLAGENKFFRSYSNVLGVVAIESHLWSSYLPEARNAPQAPAKWVHVQERLSNMQSQRVSHTGPLPGAGLPIMYLVSGRALNSPKGQKPYQAVFASLRSGSGPVAFAAIKGAGPLDYQDFPLTHPLYSFLLPGLKGAKKSKDPVNDTASIISNFTSLLLEQSRSAKTSIPPRYAIHGSLYVESRGLPGFRL